MLRLNQDEVRTPTWLPPRDGDIRRFPLTGQANGAILERVRLTALDTGRDTTLIFFVQMLRIDPNGLHSAKTLPCLPDLSKKPLLVLFGLRFKLEKPCCDPGPGFKPTGIKKNPESLSIVFFIKAQGKPAKIDYLESAVSHSARR